MQCFFQKILRSPDFSDVLLVAAPACVSEWPQVSAVGRVSGTLFSTCHPVFQNVFPFQKNQRVGCG
jgi:hypothetical protein